MANLNNVVCVEHENHIDLNHRLSPYAGKRRIHSEQAVIQGFDRVFRGIACQAFTQPKLDLKVAAPHRI